jgi:hypothetical protein
MKKSLILIVPAVVLFFGCGQFNKSETVNVEGLYSMTMAKDLSPRDDLNEEASLQYGNILKELYIICIHESHEEFENALLVTGLDSLYTIDLEGYAELLLDGMLDQIEAHEEPVLRDISVNGLSGKKTAFDANSGGVDAHFQIAYIRGKENYYQIWTWTLMDRKEKHATEMDEMIRSFKEI